jgi:hypothetical protein
VSSPVRRQREAARQLFLTMFPGGFQDPRFLDWERDYKVEAHRLWMNQTGGRIKLATAIAEGRHEEVAAAAVRIESSRALLFSFEKMALRDAIVRSHEGAVRFAEGIYDWFYGSGGEQARFERWVEVVTALPRRQTRVATWPIVTVFGSIARPKVHVFVKPLTMQRAADAYGFDLRYRSKPSWATYGRVLELAETVSDDLADLGPRDQIDIQSFLWIIGSNEYADERRAARRRAA